jgi:hypothetical protein
MKFMNYHEASALAKMIRQEVQRGGVNATVGRVFPATELRINRELYPQGSYLVEVIFHLVDGKSEEWIQNEEHWNAVK